MPSRGAFFRPAWLRCHRLVPSNLTLPVPQATLNHHGWAMVAQVVPARFLAFVRLP
jgi:hypothetical protein